MSDKNLEAVRLSIEAWLIGKVRIDEFNADPPKKLFSAHPTSQRALPANTCIGFPVRDLEYERTESNSARGKAVLPYTLVYRYASQTPLERLPYRDIESLVEYLHVAALMDLSGCSAISDVSMEQEEVPVNIARDGTDQDDWLISAYFSFVVEFAVTAVNVHPDYAPAADPDPSAQIERISISTYRADAAAIEDNTLDANLLSTITPNP